MDEAADRPDDDTPAGIYVLSLYVTSSSPRSLRAIINVRALCDEHLPGRYQLEVVDITGRPEVARREQLLASPTLVKREPLPLRRFVGDMSRTERLLRGLDLWPPEGRTRTT